MNTEIRPDAEKRSSILPSFMIFLWLIQSEDRDEAAWSFPRRSLHDLSSKWEKHPLIKGHIDG